MRRPKAHLPVVYTVIVRRELDEIADYNEKAYDRTHAKDYITFLRKNMDGLSKTYAKGKPVDAHPGLRYIQMRRKSRGHGHVAVYTVQEKGVVILHVFHSAQDWQTKIEPT